MPVSIPRTVASNPAAKDLRGFRFILSEVNSLLLAPQPGEQSLSFRLSFFDIRQNAFFGKTWTSEQIPIKKNYILEQQNTLSVSLEDEEINEVRRCMSSYTETQG